MLPVCSATTHSQVSIHGGLRSFSSCSKTFEVKCNMVDRVVVDLSNGLHLQEISLKTQSTTSFSSSFIENTGRCSPMDITNRFSHQNEINYVKDMIVNNYYYPMSLENEELGVVESADPSMDLQIMDFANQIDNTSTLPESSIVQPETIMGGMGDNPDLVSDTLPIDTNSLSSLKTNDTDTFAVIVKTIRETVNNGENAVDASVNEVISSVTSAINGAKETFNNAIGEVKSSVDKSGDLADGKLTGLSSDFKEASGRIGVIAVNVLRNTIVVVEDSLAQGAKSIVYGYGSVKELLPPEIQDALNLSEEKATFVLRPLGTAVQQAYGALEELEKAIGIDPNDPIVTFVLFLGASATLWVSYRVLTYGGYSGDLSAKSTLELLSGKEKAVLIDIRPEDLRERDGIPDLRRTARSRYANVTLPEVDGSVKKLVKSGKELDGTLVAAVIRNLKIVQDRSKVIVMDADGTRSKGIARSLRKLGIKRPYPVQGGFRSWVKEGLRIKELKPETALTILNEEAEAILEEFNPTPLQLLGYGAGFIATVYGIVEWEKTLQLVGVVGLGQTIYRRFTSYGDAEDLKQDLRSLLVPVQLGGQAVSWAAAKLETSRNGLPTSPSSLDVQNRVLQAAAKHESQPLDDEGLQDLSPESQAPVNENTDPSEV